ncbi:hypothetical protein NB311A_07588 [Nitrobacter sp. Nb-311A]|uniref:hypothetical protein n=1 Tax=unclassified Nitrobacter TaxID=2620411 RepID=UPI0000684B95|nr:MULTISPECIES: hypothetical protein [unclassified Nitrobacter]EAQ36994.1 hypothetical protein NB311A_07588 [Nitrobacter sp. Nb-311A]MCV0387425.1 hypothetical protein [Nitrobacter sp.]
MMTRLPSSLSVSLWGVGVCWVAVAIGYLMDSATLPVTSLLISLVVLLVIPLVVIGVLGGND